MVAPDSKEVDVIIENMVKEHRLAFCAVAAWRRQQRLHVVESTIETLRKSLPHSPITVPVPRSLPPQHECLPMPDVLDASLSVGGQSHPQAQPAADAATLLSREELKRQLTMLYKDPPVAPSAQAATKLPAIHTDVATRQQVIEQLRKLYAQ